MESHSPDDVLPLGRHFYLLVSEWSKRQSQVRFQDQYPGKGVICISNGVDFLFKFQFYLTRGLSGDKKSFCADPNCQRVAAVVDGTAAVELGWSAVRGGCCVLTQTQSGAIVATVGSRKSGETFISCSKKRVAVGFANWVVINHHPGHSTRCGAIEAVSF